MQEVQHPSQAAFTKKKEKTLQLKSSANVSLGNFSERWRPCGTHIFLGNVWSCVFEFGGLKTIHVALSLSLSFKLTFEPSGCLGLAGWQSTGESCYSWQFRLVLQRGSLALLHGDDRRGNHRLVEHLLRLSSVACRVIPFLKTFASQFGKDHNTRFSNKFRLLYSDWIKHFKKIFSKLFYLVIWKGITFFY